MGVNDTLCRDIELDLAAQSRMVAALARSLGDDVQVLETHISFVLLTARHAYKIKKAVALGFLDFTTLASRGFYCREELRLNRRFAPQIYVDVVPVTGSREAPVLGGDGPVIDYAVRMRKFAQEALATHTLERRAMTPQFVDALANRVAAVHAKAQVDRSHGAAEEILEFATRNFARLHATCSDRAVLRNLDTLAAWTSDEYRRIEGALRERRARGRVRECHGDLHLGNIAVIDGQPVIFDCIEFNEALRMIDVMSDVAFVVMDLADRGRPDFAHRFLDGYLEITGDYDGLRVLRFYVVYRALVRAMVCSERSHQMPAGDVASQDETRRYVDLAMHCIEPQNPAIVITHGFSGCGKSTSSQAFVECTGAVRIRTDVERKRLHNLRPTDRETPGAATTMYSNRVTRWVYLRVVALARGLIAAGYPVIVDGTFLKRWQRDAFRSAAAEMDVPFVIVSFEAAEATLRARIQARGEHGRDASDADLAVLEAQLRSHDPLDSDERMQTVVLDNETTLAALRAPERWRGVIDRSSRPGGLPRRVVRDL